MKKLLLITLICLFILLPTDAKTNKLDENYLKNKKHFAILNPFAEKIAEKAIKNVLVKKIGKGSYDIDLDGYTISSLKKGVFKNIEIDGTRIDLNDIPIPHLNLKTVSDYNWIDYNEKPAKIKSDMTFAYEIEISEDSLNTALKQKKFKKNIEKINRIAYPLFTLQHTKTRIKNNRVYIIMDYTLPLSSSQKTKTFIASTNFKVKDGSIKAADVVTNRSYGNLPLDKVTNLVNLIDPLGFTLTQLCENNCQGKIENVNIEDNNIHVSGKIYIVKNKGE